MTIEILKPQCGNCKHGADGEGQGQVRCTRYPPQLILMPSPIAQGMTLASLFPIVDADGLCGEYARRPR